VIVRTTELARILGCSPERIYRLFADGKIPREGPNRWDPEKVKAAIAQNVDSRFRAKKKQNQGELNERLTTQAHETWRWTKEKADLAELERKRLQESLWPAEKVNTWNGGMIMKAAEILDRIPVELADRLAQQSDPAACCALLKRELDRARFQLAEYRNA
jgi:phage terminase Nu1 subunit (DNA packaging protein)